MNEDSMYIDNENIYTDQEIIDKVKTWDNVQNWYNNIKIYFLNWYNDIKIYFLNPTNDNNDIESILYRTQKTFELEKKLWEEQERLLKEMGLETIYKWTLWARWK